MPLTRLAPSPTGALHLGNARTFLVNWLMARQKGWRILLRIEDLDGPRVKPRADLGLIDDLRWLGLDWDDGPIYQTERAPMYADAVARLLKSGAAYPCVCSRKEVELAASAPHAEDGSAVYPGTCRGKFASMDEARRLTERTAAVRFEATDQPVTFNDGFSGIHTYNVAKELGDFVIARNDGTAAYQLAVVVDDADSGITHVVRGDDLLDSTPRQILLYQALGLSDHQPSYFHLPLVIGTDGRRLAKRHGDTRLSYYREKGVSPGRVLALLARWSGIHDTGDSATARDLIGRFDLSHVPKSAVVFSAEEDAWLNSVTVK